MSLPNKSSIVAVGERFIRVHRRPNASRIVFEIAVFPLPGWPSKIVIAWAAIDVSIASAISTALRVQISELRISIYALWWTGIDIPLIVLIISFSLLFDCPSTNSSGHS